MKRRGMSLALCAAMAMGTIGVVPAMADVQMCIPVPVLSSKTYAEYTGSHVSCKQTELLLTESDIPLLTDLFHVR